MSGSVYFPLTGAAYLAQLDNGSKLAQKLAVCTNCLSSGSDAVLRRCTGCHIAAYCSKGCQKQHWPGHRAFCNMVQAKGKKNAYLSGLDREECFQQLIDSYRLRVESDHQYRHEDHGVYLSGKLGDGLVWADGDVYDDFQHYLDLAEDTGILPDWWSFEDRMECLAAAVDESSAENVLNKADSRAVLQQYGSDATIRTALCVLAELVVGYEGRRSVTDDNWIHEFRQSLDTQPDEKDKLISRIM